MKIEDILKAQGYTDAEIAAVAPLLGDAKFRGAVETHLIATGTALEQFRTENDKWADWAEKVNKPQLDTFRTQNLELTSQVGSLDARVRALDPTYKPGVPGAPPERKEPTVEEKKYLTQEIFDQKVNEYAAAQGTAIAMANDLAFEYKRLTGSDMLDYQTTDSEGRSMSGMSALLMEARRDKKPLPDYIASKFDFAGKRLAASTAARQAAEDAIRKDERAKVTSEYSNPNTRPGMPSRNPFIPQREGAEAGKMPWGDNGIVPKERMRQERVSRAVDTQTRSVN